MRLGRKLSEGFTVDDEAEAPLTPVADRPEAERAVGVDAGRDTRPVASERTRTG